MHGSNEVVSVLLAAGEFASVGLGRSSLLNQVLMRAPRQLFITLYRQGGVNSRNLRYGLSNFDVVIVYAASAYRFSDFAENGGGLNAAD